MSLIFEAILTTAFPNGDSHIAPLGFRREGDYIILAPFHPSRTLDNLRTSAVAAISHIDDVRVFAGCLTGRRKWPLIPCSKIVCSRLAGALSHSELKVERIEEDPIRPQFYCRELVNCNHTPFQGYNRAQAAIIEACILISRLHILPIDKVDREMSYLSIAIDKTAGPREQEAWKWIQEKIMAHRSTGQIA